MSARYSVGAQKPNIQNLTFRISMVFMLILIIQLQQFSLISCNLEYFFVVVAAHFEIEFHARVSAMPNKNCVLIVWS